VDLMPCPAHGRGPNAESLLSGRSIVSCSGA
jgi:hypothetical protein